MSYQLIHEGYVPHSEEDLKSSYNWLSGVDYYSYGETKAEIRTDKRGIDYLYFSLERRFSIGRHLEWCKERSLHDAFNVNDSHHSFISSGCFFDRPKSISALIWSRKPAVHKFNAWYESYVYDKAKKFWYKKTKKGTLTAGRKHLGNSLKDAFSGVKNRYYRTRGTLPSILESVKDPETVRIISTLADGRGFVNNVSRILEGECVS